MNIEKVTWNEMLEKTKGKEGLVMLGAGGDPNEWVNGIAELLKESGSADSSIPEELFQAALLMTSTGGRNDLVLVFADKAPLNIGRLAMWRLQFGDNNWISDFKVNYAKHYDAEPEGEEEMEESCSTYTAASAKRHKKGLSSSQRRKWAHVANAARKSGASKGSAIRQANAVANESLVEFPSLGTLTTAVRQYFADIEKEAKEAMIPPEKYWSYLTSKVLSNLNAKAEDIVSSGMPSSLVIDALDIETCDRELTEQGVYNTLLLKITNPETKKAQITSVPLKDVLSTVSAAGSKAKDTSKYVGENGKVDPILVLKKGDYNLILNLFNEMYKGKQLLPKLNAVGTIEAWGIPDQSKQAAQREAVGRFVAFLLTEHAHGNKAIFEKQAIEGFNRKYRPELEKLFPHINPVYLHNIIQEAQTALDAYDMSMIDRLFPNVNKEYLKSLFNCKSSSMTSESLIGVKPLKPVKAKKTRTYFRRGW